MLEIDGCKPFEILNIGKYERQYWQTIQFWKQSKEQTLAEYIAFILKLFKAECITRQCVTSTVKKVIT